MAQAARLGTVMVILFGAHVGNRTPIHSICATIDRMRCLCAMLSCCPRRSIPDCRWGHA